MVVREAPERPVPQISSRGRIVFCKLAGRGRNKKVYPRVHFFIVRGEGKKVGW